MALVDYYAVLNISRNATDKEIYNAYATKAQQATTLEKLKLVSDAREVLEDTAARARYDKLLGYAMVIQTQEEPQLNAMCYQLMQPQHAHIILLAIKEDFKIWVSKKTALEWDEAQEEGYGYELFSESDYPSLLLRFARESDLASYARKLMDERRIKS